MKKLFWVVRILVVFLLIFLTYNVYQTKAEFEKMSATMKDNLEVRNSVSDFMDASNYLTSQARLYVVNDNNDYLINYLNELNINRRREKALEQVEKWDETDEIKGKVEKALEESYELGKSELKALKILAVANTLSSDVLKQLEGVELSAFEGSCNRETARELAMEMIFDSEYVSEKIQIEAKIQDCVAVINKMADKDTDESVEKVTARLKILYAFIVISIILEVFIVVPLITSGDGLSLGARYRD